MEFTSLFKCCLRRKFFRLKFAGFSLFPKVLLYLKHTFIWVHYLQNYEKTPCFQMKTRRFILLKRLFFCWCDKFISFAMDIDDFDLGRHP